MPKRARVLVSAMAGLCAVFLTLLCAEWTRWLDQRLQAFLLKFLPKAFVVSMTDLTYPTAYLLGAWALGFLLSFAILGLDRDRFDKPDE